MKNKVKQLRKHKIKLKNTLSKKLIDYLKFSKDDADKISLKLSDDVSRINIITVLSFLQYTENVKEDAFVYRLVGLYFTVESLTVNRTLNEVKEFFRECLSEPQKVSLLLKMQFSAPFEYGAPYSENHHIMFFDILADKEFKRVNYITKIDNCNYSANRALCYCEDWLNINKGKVDKYLDIFVERLYEMRNAITHSAFSVLGFPIAVKGQEANTTLSDTYIIARGRKIRFRSYTSSLSFKEFEEIIRNGIRTKLKKILEHKK